MSAPLVRTGTPGIYRRGGRYVVKERDQAGRMHTRSAATLAEARDIKATLRSDAARGDLQVVTQRRFDEYAREWIATYTGRSSRGFKESTRDGYRGTLERHCIPYFGKMRLSEIHPRDVKKYARWVADSGVRPLTVRNALVPLKALLATAFEDGDIRVNPAANVRTAGSGSNSEEGVRTRALTPAQLEIVLAKVPAAHWLPVAMLARTGMRVGELAGLEWRDLDLKARRLKVNRRWYQGELAAPKSRYGVRTVPLSRELVVALTQLRLHQPNVAPTDPVFTNRDGGRYVPANLLRYIFRPAAIEAGAPWATLHTLRHTFASTCFRNGCNAKQVQMLLGHHSPAFTLEVYVHMLPEDLPDLDFLDDSPTIRAVV